MPARNVTRKIVRRLVAAFVLILACTLLLRFLSSSASLRFVLLALLAAALCVWVARGVQRSVDEPLSELKAWTARILRGDLLKPPEPLESDDFADLAALLERIIQDYDARIQSLIRQNQEQQAVLSSMDEGVLAVDPEERVISMNWSATRLLGVSPDEIQGRRLQEIVRNADLRRFVVSALASNIPVEGDVDLHHPRERVLHAKGTALRDSAGRGIGAVIVLDDVSRMRQLENMRRDFAANVSHELKTPITSIKGFVETLLEGALRDPMDAERFLRIILRQADRLNAIIEDLLSLSRIETDGQTDGISLTHCRLLDVLEGAIADYDSRANERRIQILLSCDAEIQARVNAPLLQQAVGNLLDNAIKYSELGAQVDVRVERSAQDLLIHVQDRGCGIAEEHHARLFERFYRVDKARSRKLGGTGLGLAIVKHIVLAHEGQVTLTSAMGKGSTFTVRLRAAPDEPFPRPSPANLGNAAAREPGK